VIFAEAAPAFQAGFSATGAAAMTKTARRKGSQSFMAEGKRQHPCFFLVAA
jgi:hypothetical protein